MKKHYLFFINLLFIKNLSCISDNELERIKQEETKFFTNAIRFPQVIFNRINDLDEQIQLINLANNNNTKNNEQQKLISYLLKGQIMRINQARETYNPKIAGETSRSISRKNTVNKLSEEYILKNEINEKYDNSNNETLNAVLEKSIQCTELMES